ncbi:MAG: hypothetical protein HQ559_04035 [Lentisphaerae bacterium]|nr:hypothetical protein [Lentisphaerota bacterium]
MKKLCARKRGKGLSLLIVAGLVSLGVGMLGCEPDEGTAADGPGTGDSTIKGNVASIGANAAYAGGPARAGVSGVTVSIDGTDLKTVSGGGGQFVLTGVPNTKIELRFTAGAVVGILVLDMPPGTTLELRDVKVTPESVEVGQIYEVEVETVTTDETVPGTTTVPGEDGWSDEDSGDDESGEDDEDGEDDDS